MTSGKSTTRTNGVRFRGTNGKGIARGTHSAPDRPHPSPSLDHIQTYLDLAGVMFVALDRQGRVVLANRKAGLVLGCAPSEIVGQDWFATFLPPTERTRVRAGYDGLMSGHLEHMGYFENSVLTKDGRTPLIAWHNTILRDEAGAITGTLSSGEDITERKQAEEVLESLARFPSENPDPVLRIGRDGNLLYTNEAGRALLPDWTLAVGQPAPQMLREAVSEALSGQTRNVIETTQAGRILLFFVTPVPKTDYANLYGRDTTERRRAREAAIQAQNALLEQQRREKEHIEADLASAREELVRTTRLATIGQVSASIAHDLRNPLGAARNACFLLKRRLPPEPHLLDLLEIIDKETSRADQIISRLLTMARVRTPCKQRVDLGRMITAVVERIDAMRQVRLVLSLDPDPFWVHADPVGLDLVVSNLTTNAADAMMDQGTFYVTGTHDTGEDTIVLRDTGPGIAPDAMLRLFDPLMTTKASGTGLGLPICREIVEKHGGTIKAANVPDGGAAFTIRLPQT